MTRPRSQLISLETTPYYHCIARCVRRAFLCGSDSYSGRNFDHRKKWLVERIKLLESVFAVDVAAYAVMSNHYHLVLHIDADQSQNWSMDEVIHRWRKLYKGPLLVQHYLEGESLSDDEHETIEDIVNVWRQRLSSISWFMACLNEYIARQANKEDGCKGRFWEGRFKSQALLDETALLSCMAYVDLNPVRAGLSDSLEASTFTSIQQRLQQAKSFACQNEPFTKQSRQPTGNPRLMPFAEYINAKEAQIGIPFSLTDYIALVEWTGLTIRSDKKGFIEKSTSKALNALGLSASQWKTLALTVQKQSVLMLHGLTWLEAFEEKQAKQNRAA